MYKPIQVPPEVHATIQQIAKANRRTIGGQVAFWASACKHPTDNLQPVGNTDLSIGYNSHTVHEHVVILRCRDCGELVIVRGFDTGEGQPQ